MTIDKRSPEYLFVVYVFSFVFLKPIIALCPQYSSKILFFCTTLLILRRLMVTASLNRRSFNIWFFCSIFFGGTLLIGNYLNNYEQTNQYIINFIIYGIIPLFFLIGVEDFSSVLCLISRISFYSTILLIWDPLVDYAMTGDYMTYGFFILWYSFSGLLLAYFYYEKRYALPLIIIDLFAMLVYANKGSIFCAIFLLFIVILMKQRLNLKKFLLMLIAVIVVVSWKKIIISIVSILSKLGYSSYSLSTLSILASDRDLILSSRTNIWKEALSFFMENPLGSGVGAFEKVANGYAHNLELDIMVSFGIGGITIFIAMLVWAVFRIAEMENKEKRIFLIGCGACWFIPMQISLTLWNVLLFWVFWGVLLYDRVGQRIGMKYENTY